jgi:hypothetical protein
LAEHAETFIILRKASVTRKPARASLEGEYLKVGGQHLTAMKILAIFWELALCLDQQRFVTSVAASRFT